jgi:signal transduction histidine kinase/ActR/RegA family two-component response regulator
MFALLAAAMLTVVALGWVVARDFRQSAEAANQLYDRFGEGLDVIDTMLFETGEVRRILLYALHTSDANLQLEYVDQSRSAEARVGRLLESRSAVLSTERTRAARESVVATWTEYLQTRDEVVGLILEGSLREAVALDEALGTARFNRVRNAIADLKSSFKADAAAQVETERARSARAIRRLGLIVLSALFLVVIGVYLVNRRASLETVLRVKSDFLATMSHELRTPLTGVIGITDLLHAGRIRADQRELVRMLRTNATTLLGLINNVLDYSRIEAGLMALAPKPFPLQAPVEEALDSVSEAASRKGLALGYVIAPGVPDVIADEERVRQVLLNLLSNAVKYTETGEVAIHVDAALERQEIVAVTIRVRDTGIGIPGELQQRLFQWFSHIEPSGGRRIDGAGLGLAISDRLSRLLGGSMAVESRPGKGSTFTFVFRGIAAGPSCAIDTAHLHGARVFAILAAGIVGDQIQSVLRCWNVQTVVHDAGSAPPDDIDAVVVDADACGGALYDSLLRNRALWGLQRTPVITIAPLRPASDRAVAEGEHLVATPVRAQALHDALCAATGRRSAADERVATPTPAFDGKRLNVLLVEDNESNRRVVAMMLGELGLDADEAAGGHEAVQRAAHRRYDIILMDVQMPDLDGLETTRRIRARERDHRAAIIALTANVFESDEARCRAAGMDGYLQKPLSLDTLSAALSAVVPSAQ